MQKILFCINPRSGRGDREDFYQFLNKFPSDQFSYRLYEINSSGDADKIKYLIIDYRPDIVAAVGGDGTVNLISKILIYRNEKLAIIPYGSANGMAKELGINNAEIAFDALITGLSKQIDLLSINDHIIIHLGDVGLNARIIKRFEQENVRGLKSYAKQLLKEIFLTRQYSFEIIFDGIKIKRKAIMIVFANAAKYGTGAIINPIGKIDDGKFEICIIKPFPFYYLFIFIIKFFKGSLNSSKYVEIISCREAFVKSNKKLLLHCDGEIINKTNRISVTIKPKSLNIIIPKP